MGDLFRYFIWLLTRLVLPLRYDVRVHGLDQIRGINGPVLLLPNHPGLIDPVLILSTFYGVARPRTVLYEGNFSGLIRTFFIKLLRAVPVPDLHRPSKEALERTEQAIAEVIAGLHRGEHFVLWPSGHAQRDGVEHLGAARALTDILRAVPETNLVLIRTRGVWGSMFSVAQTGQLPHLGLSLFHGALLLLSNLFVFMPRRRIDITIELIDRQELPALERNQVNRWFESRYNVEGPEQPTFVPYHFLFGAKSFQFPSSLKLAEDQIDREKIRPETWKTVAEMISERLGQLKTPEELMPETKLEDLGLDSLQRMDLAFAIEQRFNVSTDSAPDSVGALLALAEGLSKTIIRKPPAEWLRPPRRVEALQVFGETIPESFVMRALANPGDVAAADDFSGVVTYERLLIGALLMSRRFARLPETNVGLLLPASIASDLMLMGLYLGNKRPVLLNWTTGPANLRHSVQLTGITHVVTSRGMRERLGDAMKVEGIQFLDVEDLQKSVSWAEKLSWLLRVRFLPGTVRRLVPRMQPDNHAVILFTSGSEKAPKAVPLTHRNIISNVKIVPEILDLTNRDALLGFLPMFHSFGFTVTALFPLLSGVRVVHHPDPTDAAGLINKIASYLPTVMVGMPSIVGRLLDQAKPKDLESLSLIAVGAEACPAALYDKVRAVIPKAILLEGYGVTECSPLIAGNRPDACRPGTVGQPLPGIEVCVMKLETDEVLPSGKMGMLVVNGPGVFPGYLGDEPSPFVHHQGKRWFVTGDLAEIDSEGFIHFQGRLKRFIKSGGEMISLPALEEPFVRRYPPDQDGPHVAVEGIETETGRNIVLFTTEPIAIKDASTWLTDDGFRGVMRLDSVRRLDEIPVLGNGKIDYRRLRTMIKEESSMNA